MIKTKGLMFLVLKIIRKKWFNMNSGVKMSFSKIKFVKILGLGWEVFKI